MFHISIKVIISVFGDCMNHCIILPKFTFRKKSNQNNNNNNHNPCLNPVCNHLIS